MGKIIDVKTENVIAIKTLFEVLKDIFNNINIEFRRDAEKNLEAEKEDKENKTRSAIEDEDDDDEDDDEDTVKKQKDGKDKEKKDEEGGIKIVAMDPSQCLLINVKLDAKEFERFWCKKKSYDIGVSLIELNKFLKSLENEGILNIFVNENDKQNIVLKVDNSKKKYETIYKLKLRDINRTKIPIPPIPFDSIITINAAEFHRICKEMSQISELMEIICTRKSITFTCKGDCSARSTTWYDSAEMIKDKGPKKDKKDDDDKKEEEIYVKINFGKNSKADIVQGTFQLKYLVMFTKFASICSSIQIFMKNGLPLCIKYSIATLGRILFCLSPYEEDRIDKDFDDDEEHYEKTEIVYKK